MGLSRNRRVLIHHANLCLPVSVERGLCRIVMKPRLHGIHHLIVDEERNTNLSSSLTIWDILHRTLKTGVPQSEIVIGVPPDQAPRGPPPGRPAGAVVRARQRWFRHFVEGWVEERNPAFRSPDAGFRSSTQPSLTL